MEIEIVWDASTSAHLNTKRRSVVRPGRIWASDKKMTDKKMTDKKIGDKKMADKKIGDKKIRPNGCG